MRRRHPRSTRTDTLFPYTTLFRSEEKMLLKLQQAIIGLNARAEQSSMFRTLRSTLVSGAAFFRTPSNATTAIAGMMEIEAKHRAETESWVNPEALASGKGGAFDACDLRRSEASRVGKECVRPCRSRWSPAHYKKQEYGCNKMQQIKTSQ